jgi:hypothetical protein
MDGRPDDDDDDERRRRDATTHSFFTRPRPPKADARGSL